MSTLLMDEGIFTSKYVPNHSRNRVLKSRENIGKLKCNKSLKKKLKKYKLRKDGQEDPDIIDVSQSLIQSLRIKSPNQQFYSQKECEENRPHNYLTKMVRLKKPVIVVEATSANVPINKIESKDHPICMTSNINQDERKKQTDAFKLLMESRNKSIGSNSPGKEKSEMESDVQERAEIKELRAKRILSLNKMAQAKGSLKKIEIEEYREESIKRKMDDRAKRLKHMIIDVGERNGNKDHVTSVKTVGEKSASQITADVSVKREILNINTSVLKTFDLFQDMKVSMKSNVKKVSKEDEEFLNKLSPSIRKKENMLCYFQKVNKEPDTLQDDDDSTCSQNKDLIIKVKLKSRRKVTKKKNKNIIGNGKKSLDNDEHDEGKVNQDLLPITPVSTGNSKKRKRNKNRELGQECVLKNCINDTVQCHSDSRPKRNTKKPVKYADDFQLTSSDEELHIFTPKKKRKDKLISESNLKSVEVQHIQVEDTRPTEKLMKTKQKIKEDPKKSSLKNEHNKNAITKKATKLAPIFVTKPILDSAAIEAKQKFLQSGVPSKLKKSSTHQNYVLASNEFQRVVHIQHLKDIFTLNPPKVKDVLNIFNSNYSEEIILNEEKNLFEKLLQVPVLDNFSMPKLHKNIDQVLQDIKKKYPKFPVYRTYHLLRGKSKGEFKDCIYPDLDNSVEILNNIVDINNVHPDKLNWADKYKPTTEKQVIGNFVSIRELKQWLVTWTENDAKSNRHKCDTDSSDFYQSDTDSRGAMRNENNLLIITGKVGTGKTLSVYAVAAELAIKVIEVNASTKRTGKIMLQDLQEATQSHKVDRGKNSTECSLQRSQELYTTNGLLNVAKKRGRKKKVKVESTAVITKKESTELTVTQDNIRTGMSLILIDDADIVFDQDDGFCNAISQLIQSSKRPVILVTSSLTCPHLQKFLSLAKVIKMRPFLPRMLGTWLDIMCLVDNNMCSPGLGAKFLDLFKGDIRRTINYLQYYMTSHKHMSKKDELNECLNEEKEISKVNSEDENSCMSWGDSEGWGDKNTGSCNSNDICKLFLNKESHFLSPLNNFLVWWNLPFFLNYSSIHWDHSFENFDKINKTKDTNALNKIAAVLDNVSVTDYLGTLNDEPNITSGPWKSFEQDSVVDNENFAIYNRNTCYINEISWELMMKSIAEAQRDINSEIKTEMNCPSMSDQRERDRVISRHNTIIKSLNPSAALDRRALALDYLSSCRSICRTEKSKTNTNSKRNNRFCHYLKSLNIVCKNEYFDNLGDSLSFK